MMKTKNEIRQESIEFLIAEYNEISKDTRRLRQEGANRLNFFITITSSIFAFLAFLAQKSPTNSTSFQSISLGAFLSLLLIGIDTLNTVIRRDINTDLNVRATSRIRLFFSKQSPEIKQYLTWRCHDEPTPWIKNNNSSFRRTVQYILSINCAIIASLIINLLGGQSVIIIIVGFIVFVGSVISFWAYAMRQFNIAHLLAQDNVRFPKDPEDMNEGK